MNQIEKLKRKKISLELKIKQLQQTQKLKERESGKYWYHLWSGWKLFEDLSKEQKRFLITMMKKTYSRRAPLVKETIEKIEKEKYNLLIDFAEDGNWRRFSDSFAWHDSSMKIDLEVNEKLKKVENLQFRIFSIVTHPTKKVVMKKIRAVRKKWEPLNLVWKKPKKIHRKVIMNRENDLHKWHYETERW